MYSEFDEKPSAPQIALQTIGPRTYIITAPNARRRDKLQFMIVYSDGTESRWVTCDGFYKELVVSEQSIKEVRTRVVSRPNWLYRVFRVLYRGISWT